MKKTTIILLLFLAIVSCNKRNDLIISKSDIAGKTFDINVVKENATDIIEFKDSTYFILGRNHSNHWDLSFYENIPFLNFERNVAGIKKVNDSVYRILRIGHPEDYIIMTIRNPKWKKEQLYGIWIEDKYVGTDSTDFPPPPIPPDNNNWNWPPSYKISENKIKLDLYGQFESDIEINNSGEFIKMDLKNSAGLGLRENSWRIKYLSDSLMIIDKRVDDILKSHGEEKLTDIKLIKKR